MNHPRILTPFGAQSTANDVLAGLDLSGRTAIVTGASAGIGLETARALAAANAQVTLAVRDLAAGLRVAGELTAQTHNPNIEVAELDLADPGSIAGFVCSWQQPLDILINNAGVMATPLSRTPQGWELQFATNHLGHFALATGLHAALASAGAARVVSVSSVGHLNGDIDFDDVHFQYRPYDPWRAYSQSKTANVLFAVEAADRWRAEGIAVNALAPGQGAATSVLLAASPLLEDVTGRYFEDCNEAELQQPGQRRGVAPHAVDPVSAARLWQISIEMLAGEYRPALSAEFAGRVRVAAGDQVHNQLAV
jgi:NAD(P)-dependent dehydrogenase (short-subunit alcohol dehydrogenase family)